ncbi:disease resistance TIR-NBS-LRR class family protein [Tanacetum coccineum]
MTLVSGIWEEMKVVNEKSPYEPGNHSRIWLQKDGSEAIEGLVLDLLAPMHLETKAFERRMAQILNIGESESLTTTPDFTGVPNLEKLSLMSCPRLLNVDRTIGHLTKLTSLNLDMATTSKTIRAPFHYITSNTIS